MRLLVLTSTFPRWQGDTEPAFVYDLCSNLADRGLSIDVLAPHAAGTRDCETMGHVTVYRYRYFPERFEKLAYAGGINANMKKYWYGPLLVPFFLFSQCLALHKRLKNERYDLVHAHWLIPQGLCCYLVFRIFTRLAVPVVCTSHGGDLYSHNNPVARYLKKKVLGMLAHLCVVSNAMKSDALQLGISAEKVSVLSMGVDLSVHFVPVDGVVREQRKLIFVGRLVEKKGVNVLIEAVCVLRQQYPDIKLVVAGDGPDRNRLQDMVERYGLADSVEFHGSLGKVSLPALFSSAAIAVVPSVIDSRGDREGLGLVAIEAMGCGCAVVVSSLAAMGDIVADGDTGRVFKMGDCNDLADKLHYLLQHPDERQQIADRGRAFVKQHYDWHAIAAHYQYLLQSYISE